jgi:hypothetical protein
VILRIPDTVVFPTTLTVGSLTLVSGYYVFTFNDSGTIGWS